MAVERKNVYRRLPLAHVGFENAVSEHTAVHVHDRALLLQIKMFFANNFGKEVLPPRIPRSAQVYSFRNYIYGYVA